jgi:hypothetical protein
MFLECSLVLHAPGVLDGSVAHVGNFLSVGQLGVQTFTLEGSAYNEAVTMGSRIFELKERLEPPAEYVMRSVN